MADTLKRPASMPEAAWRHALYRVGKIDRDAAIHWIGSKWPEARRGCIVCGENNWGVGDNIVRLQTREGPAYPSVAVVCNVCGYTMLFNAVRMGLLPEEKDR
jgi:hypothetical protein